MEEAENICDKIVMINKGKKIYITGKGRCNLTNACDTEDLFAAIMKNAKFLYSAIYTFDNHALMDYFAGLGLKMKIERGNRVFPQPVVPTIARY